MTCSLVRRCVVLLVCAVVCASSVGVTVVHAQPADPSAAGPVSSPGVVLLGPARRAGDLLRHESVMELKHASLFVQAGPQRVSGSVSINASESEDYLIQGVRGRQLTRYKRKINSNRTITRTTLGGHTTREVEKGVLEGLTVLASLTGKNWRHSLASGRKPNRKQTRAMLELSPPEPDTPYYSNQPISPGTSWKVQAAGLAGLLGNQIYALQGAAQMTFVRMHTVRRRRCARIRVSLKLTGKMNAGTNNTPMSVGLYVDGIIDRAVNIGLDLRIRLRGTLSISGTSYQQGRAISVLMKGPVVFRIRSVLRKRGRVARAVPTAPSAPMPTPAPAPAPGPGPAPVPTNPPPTQPPPTPHDP